MGKSSVVKNLNKIWIEDRCKLEFETVFAEFGKLVMAPSPKKHSVKRKKTQEKGKKVQRKEKRSSMVTRPKILLRFKKENSKDLEIWKVGKEEDEGRAICDIFRYS